MTRLGIFGGSFNPIHLAHLIIADRFVEQVGLECCYFVPAAHPPLKPAGASELAPARDRLAMVEAAIAGHPRFRLDTCEIERGGISYTFDTVMFFRQRFPEAELYLLIGADQVLEFHLWHRWKELLQLVRLCVAPRPSVPRGEFRRRLSRLRAAAPTLLEVPLLEISSTDIRHRLARGLSIRYLVPEAVWRYISEHDLYATP
jgi:nicotinate-nucleotide adenylyltransferase